MGFADLRALQTCGFEDLRASQTCERRETAGVAGAQPGPLHVKTLAERDPRLYI